MTDKPNTRRHLITWRRLTTERSARVIVFLLLFAMAFRISADTDVWWHLRLGRQIVETGQAVYADFYSWTAAGTVHYNHSALAQIVLHIAWSLAGNAGLSLFTALLAVTGMYFVYRAGSGSIYLQGFVLVIGATAAAAFWSPRPQMFSFLFATMLVWLLFDFKRRRRDRIWWVLPLMLLWSNAHGGYLFGYVLLAAFVVGELLNTLASVGDKVIPTRGLRKIILVALASLPLLVVNPLGTRVYLKPLQTLVMPELRQYISEWQAPDFTNPVSWGFVILAALVIAAVWSSRRRFDFTEWILLCGTGYMALTAARNLSFFAIIAVPIATSHLEFTLERTGWKIPRRALESTGRIALNLLLIGLVAAGVALYARYVIDSDSIAKSLSAHLPVAAVRHLQSEKYAGPMFNSYNWGGYLIYHLPEHPVFIDGRTDLYGKFLHEYHQIAAAAPGWDAKLDSWQTGFVLIETDSGLANALVADPDWRIDYQDTLASIFVREPQD